MAHATLPAVTDADHARGSADAHIVLVQYGDFECPFARQVYEIVRDVQARFPGDVRLVFRHFPLRYHMNALNAAIAAEAVAQASGVDAFWAYHDTLYANPLALRPEHLVAYAEASGAPPEAVREALAEETHKAAVLAQKRSGVRAGVRSSLNLFIGGELFEDDDVEGAILSRVIEPLKAKE